MKIAFVLVGLLCIFGSLFAVTSITTCSVLDGLTDNVYQLDADVTGAPFVEGTNNLCMHITSPDITLDCGGHSITSDLSSQIGVYVDSNIRNVTIINCKISNYISGISSGASDSEISNNVLIDNGNGIFQHGGSNNKIMFNTASNTNSPSYGIFLTASNGNWVEKNNATGATIGYKLDSANSNTLIRNVADQNPQIGIFIFSASNLNNITNNTAQNCGTGINSKTANSRNTYYSNTVAGCTNGFDVSGNGATLTNNEVFLNDNYGFFIASSNNIIKNNKAYNNGNNGFRIETNANNDANNNLFENNTVSENRFDGFSANGGIGNKYIRNTAYKNGEDGFDIAGDTALEMSENYLEANTGEGIDLSGSENSKLTKNVFVRNKNAGAYIWGNVVIDGDSHSGQTTDFIVNNTHNDRTINLQLKNVEFSGDGKTILSISDVVDASSSYAISQTKAPLDVPSPYRAFSKIDITNTSGVVKIDTISWGWDSSNLKGFNPSSFELWNYHQGTWSKLAATLSEGTLTINNLDKFSSFVIVSPPPTSSGSGGRSLPSLKFETNLSCKNNSITITSVSNGNPLSEARIAVDFGGQVKILQTNEKGIAFFDGCGQQVKVSISKEGYLPTDAKIQLADCTCKVVVPQCTNNNQCSLDNVCTNNKCTPIVCNNGKIENHVCVPTTVTPPTPQPECKLDGDCSMDKTCSANKCVAVQCTGGSVVNHVCVPTKPDPVVPVPTVNQPNSTTTDVPIEPTIKPTAKLDNVWLIVLAIFLLCGGFAIYWVFMRRK